MILTRFFFVKKIDIVIIETGNFTTTTIAAGKGEHELYLTYTYDGEFPHVQEGTKEAEQLEALVTQRTAAVVPCHIDKIRSLVSDGEL
jgi:hypothetical protein